MYIIICGFSILTIKIDCIIKIPQELLHSVRLLFATMFVAFVATTMSTPFSTGFYIKDRLDISGIIKIISYTANMCVLIVLFSIFNPSLWFVGVGSIVAALIILLGSYFSNKKLVPDFRYNMRLHSNQKVKMLLTNGLWNSINQLGNTLNSGLDLLFPMQCLQIFRQDRLLCLRVLELYLVHWLELYFSHCSQNY